MPDQEKQQPLTPQDLRQYLLNEIEASKRMIESLSNEELEVIVGAGRFDGVDMKATTEFAKGNWQSLSALGLGAVATGSLVSNANAQQKETRAMERQGYGSSRYY